MILYFDTETTGLRPGNIIQLSYILDDGKTQKGKNFYFNAQNVEPSATAVHGYTPQLILQLSKGKVFSDYATEIHADFLNAKLIVGHNCNFDVAFLISEFKRLNLQFRYNESFDTMRFFTPVLKLERSSTKMYKYPKLCELCEFYQISEKEISAQVKRIFGGDVSSLHEARFDTTAMYLSVQKSLKTQPKLFERLSNYLN